MEINEVQDPDYEVVTISNLGFVDPYGNEGLVILHSDDCLLYTSPSPRDRG